MILQPAFPDELLFSRLTRTMLVNSHCVSAFLGAIGLDKRSPIHPYLTTHLSEIASFCHESAYELMLKQTLRPLFAWGLPSHKEAILDPSTSASILLRLCQRSGSRCASRLKLRFCSACAEEDIKRYGVAYWHASHQIESVCSCWKHPVRLTEIIDYSRLHLSSQLPPVGINPPKIVTPFEFRFARYCHDTLLQMQKGRVQEDCQAVLLRKGWLSHTGNIRKDSLLKALEDLTGKMLFTSADFLPAGIRDYHYWHSISHPDHDQHPAKNLFLSFCAQCLPEYSSDMAKLPVKPDDAFLRQKICELHQDGCTYQEISRISGKSRCMIRQEIRRSFGEEGYSFVKIDAFMSTRVLRMAWAGVHRKRIAELTGLSVGSVESLISSEPGMVARRKKCKSDSLKRRHLFKLRCLLKENVALTRTEFRKACPAAYYWLYKHQRLLLDKMLPPADRKEVHRVDWSARDIISARLVPILSMVVPGNSTFVC